MFPARRKVWLHVAQRKVLGNWDSRDADRDVQLGAFREKFTRARASYRWLVRVKRRLFYANVQDFYARIKALELVDGLLLQCKRDLLWLEKARLALEEYKS